MRCSRCGSVCGCALRVVDTPTVDLGLSGAGTPADPWVLQADALGGGCSCGATLEVEGAGGHIASATSFRFFFDPGTVDPNGYGFDGTDPNDLVTPVITWNAHVFDIHEDGLYRAQSIMTFNNPSDRTIDHFVFGKLVRVDRTDLTVQNSIQDTVSTYSCNGGTKADPHFVLRLDGVYPMPAGSEWVWNALSNLNEGGTNSLDIISAFTVITKVSCCALPAGPPPD